MNDLDHSLEQEAINVVVRRTVVSGIYYIIAFAGLVASDERLYSEVPAVLGFACLFLALYLARMLVGFYQPPTDFRSARLLVAVIVAGALAWSASIIWIVGVIPEIAGTSALALATAVAISTGAIVSMYPYRLLMQLHLVALLLPIGIAVPLLVPGVVPMIFTLFLSIFGYYLWSNGKNQNNIYWQAQRDNAKLAEQALEMEALADTKSRFLAHMSHEIRTPMNGVLGMAQMLQASNLDEQQKKYVRTIGDSSQILLRIIDDVLDFVRLNDHHVELSPVSTDVVEVVRDSLEIVRPMAEAKGLELDFSTAPAIPARINTDPVRVRQILLNLLSNAIKFTARGTVTATVTQEGNRLRCSVRDSGPGIPADLREHIFEEFTQLENNNSNERGTGLGLAICKRLAGMLGGDIGVEQNPEGGSAFWFTLPLIEVEANGAVSETDDGQVAARFSSPGKNILVAEDNQVNQEVITAILAELGHAVILSEDGATAVEACKKWRPDLILMDCNMPGMDGFDATRAIRSWEERAGLPSVPIIALTAHAFPEVIDRCKTSGMNGHLAKPIMIQDLERKIDAVSGSQTEAGEWLES